MCPHNSNRFSTKVRVRRPYGHSGVSATRLPYPYHKSPLLQPPTHTTCHTPRRQSCVQAALSAVSESAGRRDATYGRNRADHSATLSRSGLTSARLSTPGTSPRPPPSHRTAAAAAAAHGITPGTSPRPLRHTGRRRRRHTTPPGVAATTARPPQQHGPAASHMCRPATVDRIHIQRDKGAIHHGFLPVAAAGEMRTRSAQLCDCGRVRHKKHT